MEEAPENGKESSHSAHASGKNGIEGGRFNDLYSSSTIVRVMKSRRMRLAGHLARVGEVTGTGETQAKMGR
jgi:hypothetical protein